MIGCPVCGESNPERAKFCLHCGAALEEGIAGEVEERKVVSVLFCDLVGFTARSEQVDPEDVRAMLRSYHGRVRTEIERFGGTLEKFVGDGVMAVFGAPVAHEDDAERAVRAALRILETIEQVNEQDDLDLSVRIGVNTGEAVVAIGANPARGDAMVSGDVVNTASRLQGVAPAGGVVVGEVTQRATKAFVEYRQLAAASLRGKADPVAVWQAVGLRSGFGTDVEQRPATPFLGRDPEVVLLRQTLLRAIRESSVQLVTITGEPGVGKSRLLWELKSSVDDDVSIVIYWRQGRCLSYGDGITFWALGEMVKSHAAILESDSPQEARTKLEVAVSAVIDEASQAGWLVDRLAPLVGASGGDRASRDESFAAWRSFLELIAGHHPLVLVFEDIHWADDALLDFVDHLTEWSSTRPMLVLCSARPELYERHPGWAGGKRNSTTLALSPLSDEDTGHLVSSMVANAVLPHDVRAQLLERASGNPLFAEEFVRMLLDRGLLNSDGTAPASGGQIPLPDTIQATIAARLDSLPASRKSLIHDASVIGKVFWSGALASMGGIERAVAEEMLHELVRKELVRPARTSTVRGEAEYSFWHALVRDVAYAQIPRAGRASRHRLAASWIEETAGERVADVAEQLAYHYGQALDLARALGSNERLDELEKKARDALELAGDRAAQLDLRKAYRFYQRAGQLAPPATSVRGRLLVAMVQAGGMAFGGAGELGPDESERVLQDAIDDFRAAGDTLREGDAAVQLSRQLWFRGANERAEPALADAIKVLEPSGPTRELADAYAEMAGRHMLAAHEAEWAAWTDRALELSRTVGAGDVYARALQFRGFLREFAGDPMALVDMREAVDAAMASGRLQVIEAAYANLADMTHEIEGPEAGLALYREGVALLRRRGVGALWPFAESTRPLYALGRWDEVLTVADEVIESDRHAGITQLTGVVLPQKARVVSNRGDPDQARGLLDAYLPRAREAHDPPILYLTLIALAHCALAMDDRDAATSHMEEMLGTPDGWDGRFFTCMWALPDAARILAQLGEYDRAEAVSGGPTSSIPLLHRQVVASRAAIEEARGHASDALALYLEVEPWWASQRCRYEHAQALFGAARCALLMGDSASAEAKLRQARDTFSDLGATPLRGQVDALLARA